MVRETETFDDCLLASIGQNSNNQEYKSQTSKLPCWRCQLFVSREVRMTKCIFQTFKLQSEKYLALFELASCWSTATMRIVPIPSFSFLTTRKTPRLEDVAYSAFGDSAFLEEFGASQIFWPTFGDLRTHWRCLECLGRTMKTEPRFLQEFMEDTGTYDERMVLCRMGTIADRLPKPKKYLGRAGRSAEICSVTQHYFQAAQENGRMWPKHCAHCAKGMIDKHSKHDFGMQHKGCSTFRIVNELCATVGKRNPSKVFKHHCFAVACKTPFAYDFEDLLRCSMGWSLVLQKSPENIVWKTCSVPNASSKAF